MTAGHPWTPLDKPQKYKKEEFARRVHEQFQFDPYLNPAEIIQAVLRVMCRMWMKASLGV